MKKLLIATLVFFYCGAVNMSVFNKTPDTLFVQLHTNHPIYAYAYTSPMTLRPGDGPSINTGLYSPMELILWTNQDQNTRLPISAAQVVQGVISIIKEKSGKYSIQ